MTDKKLYILQQEKENIIAALDSYIDYITMLEESFFNEDGSLKLGLPPDERVENLIKSSNESKVRYENVRQKLINDDFNLSLLEIDYAMLALKFVIIKLNNNIKTFSSAKEKIEDIIKVLVN